MAITLPEIKELKEYLVSSYHQRRIAQQEEDETFYNDTFSVPWIKDESNIVRTGKAARMIDGPAEHIITNNPQVFRYPSKEKKSEDAAQRVGGELNRWAKILMRQQPQPFKEHAKQQLKRGEAWIYLPHNDDYDPANPLDLPVNFIIPDPTVVFLDPEGTDALGCPKRLIVTFERVASEVHRNYPEWAWRKRGSKKWSDTIPFMMYFDEENRYFEADSDALLNDEDGEIWGGTGIQPNIYGFVPFVHCYSGFGSASADGDPANLAVGRLRWVKDLLREQTAIRSVINTLTYKFAYKSIDIIYDASQGSPPTGDIGEKYSRGLNAMNVIGVPPNTKIEVSQDQLPDAQLFQHLYNIEKQIDTEDPLGTYSQPLGTSGRQQDMAQVSGLKRYETIVDNTANSFAAAFGLAMRLCEKIKKLYPKDLKAGDIGGNYDCDIRLRAEDPVSQDRLRMLGSRLYQQQEIDLETNLTEYQGFTQEEAQNIMAKILVDNVTRNNPIVADILGRQMAKEAGLEQEYEALKQAETASPQSASPMSKIGSEGGPPRVGNIQTQMGAEQADMSLAQKGVRRAPLA